ncbi:efflux RND transporter periplasmic adaptor subunit [Candidatus Parcubacteria bacterium]|nr:MAG: efflux RND transporter periplasmic adaptor subunit [Candidatus Parcubacteria bacterium]
MHYLRSKLRKKSVAATLFVVLAVTASYQFFRAPEPETPFITVTRNSVVQEVSVTGTTKPVKSVQLAFERSGRIVRVHADVGEKVSVGQALVTLDQGELLAQLREAEANVDAAEAKLAELERGTRPEDIRIKQTELEKTRQDLANEYDSIPTVLNDAYAKADDAVRKQVDELFSNDEGVSPQLTFSTADSQLETQVEFQRALLTQELKSWRSELNLLSSTSSDQLLDVAAEKTKTRLLLIRNFLSNLVSIVASASGPISQSTINTYKTNISTALSNVNTAAASVGDQVQAIASQKITVQKTQDELNLKLAGSSLEEILAQKAVVGQTKAKAELIRAQLEKTVLRSPIEGTVTKQDAKVGEIVGANAHLTAVISESELEIEANVPEADVAKIAVGDPVGITLDAYGSSVEFRGRVAAIDPAETVVEGVPTYKTTIYFEEADGRVKPGMTANLDIIAEIKENVISVPQRAVDIRDGAQFVRVLTANSEEAAERAIATGLRGSDGSVEVISGLEVGERILRSSE